MLITNARVRRLLFTLIVGVTALNTDNPARAQSAPADSIDFDIQAQPVSAALSEFARQARVQFLLFTEGLQTIEANAVVGTYPIQEALDLLLAGTGLVGAYSPDSGVTISRTTDPDPVPDTPAAVASDDPVEQDPGDDLEAVIEEVLVTGSRIRGARNASPIVSIAREDIDLAGFATVEQVVEKLPQNFGGGASLDTLTDTANDTNVVGGNVGNLAGGTSVNLRGLGASSTLVLVDGRRLSPSGFGSAFTNVSSIPVTAIERIDVLTDGASAVYGSDAIGGVVNFVLREEYDGAETRLRYGQDGSGDLSDVLVGLSLGKVRADGSALFVYEYQDSGHLANADRAFTSTSDLRGLGGTDRRTLGGNPANIDAAGQLWAIPSGQDGRSLTAADFPADANGAPLSPLNRFDDRSLGDVLPSLKRHSAIVRLLHNFGSAELFADARLSTQETVWRRNFTPIDIQVTDANPYFVDPSGSGLTTVVVRSYALDNALGPQVNTGEIDSFGLVSGLRFELGGDWRGELAVNWAKDEQETTPNVVLDRAALDAAVNPAGPNPAPAGVFNPFGDDPDANAAVIDSLVDRSPPRESASENEIRSLGLNFEGSVFALPGGLARFAAGTEIRREHLIAIRNVDNTGEVRSDLERDVTSLYAELFLPLAGGSNRLPGIERLELSLATRYEHYSDVGDSVNPKLGVAWSPADELTVRGTYGRSFKAPSLLDLDVGRSSANLAVYFPQSFVDIGAVPFPMIGLTGNNDELKPEKATTWTAGVEWRPAGSAATLLSLTYFDVDLDNRIALPLTSFMNSDDPRFAALVNRDPTPAEIETLVNSPGWVNPGGASEDDLLSGAAPVAIVDGRLNNLARSLVTGVELELRRRFETSLGIFDARFDGQYMFDFERALLDVDPLLEEVDTYGRPIDFRARAGLIWRRGGWTLSTFLNYTDDYTDRLTQPNRNVASWTTWDLGFSYRTGPGRGVLANTRLVLTVQNAMDEDPPFVNTPAGLGYDSYNADPEGRVFALELAKEW